MSLGGALLWGVLAVAASGVVVVVAIVLLRTVVKKRMRQEIREAIEEPHVPRCYKCGYDMRGQNFPRCPECGALLGFDVPLEDLPLTDEERKLIDEKCRGVQRESRQPPQGPKPPDDARRSLP